MNRFLLRALVLSGIAIGAATAQNAASEKELRLRFGNAAARASAWFQSAEAALDEAHTALDRNDAAEADEAIIRAQALIDRFARHFGN
jgi:phage shock protein A